MAEVMGRFAVKREGRLDRARCAICSDTSEAEFGKMQNVQQGESWYTSSGIMCAGLEF